MRPLDSCNSAWLLLLCMAAAGCARSEFTPVRGMVKLDGQPLAGASILFLAQDPGGRDARGSTDADGVFRLTTLAPNDGALPGNYKVVVQPPAELRTGPAAASPDEAQQAATSGQSTPVRSAVSVPDRYRQPDLTVLSQVIPARGDVVLDLQSK